MNKINLILNKYIPNSLILEIKCENLKKIEGDKVAITEMLKVIVHNYSLYYECSTKVDGWQDWYNEQKKIFDNVK